MIKNFKNVNFPGGLAMSSFVLSYLMGLNHFKWFHEVGAQLEKIYINWIRL